MPWQTCPVRQEQNKLQTGNRLCSRLYQPLNLNSSSALSGCRDTSHGNLQYFLSLSLSPLFLLSVLSLIRNSQFYSFATPGIPFIWIHSREPSREWRSLDYPVWPPGSTTSQPSSSPLYRRFIKKLAYDDICKLHTSTFVVRLLLLQASNYIPLTLMAILRSCGMKRTSGYSRRRRF
jgi:hypothetical protein